MTALGFYHLTRTPLETALPALLARTLRERERAVVVAPKPEQLAALDAALWEAPGELWLPHGTAADGDAPLQPIWLTTTEEAPNGARFLFLTGGAATAQWDTYARIFDLFDGNDADAVAAARTRWRAAAAAGLAPVYWQQGPRGWERKSG
jgi:DNA polymerase-3 subunit chi